jgi:hypothetical protein
MGSKGRSSLGCFWKSPPWGLTPAMTALVGTAEHHLRAAEGQRYSAVHFRGHAGSEADLAADATAARLVHSGYWQQAVSVGLQVVRQSQKILLSVNSECLHKQNILNDVNTLWKGGQCKIPKGVPFVSCSRSTAWSKEWEGRGALSLMPQCRLLNATRVQAGI